jgi:hypothetical protein
LTQLLETISADTDVFAFRTKLMQADTDPCVVAEAVEAFPPNSNRADDKEFTNHQETNDILGRVFKALRKSPLTHGQFKYLLNKAHAKIGAKLLENKEFAFDLILDDPYARAVNQIVVTYATRFGTGYALDQMNENNDGLHKNSEGSLKANEVLLRILHPPKTNKGYAESLTSFVIRSTADPALVTHAIKIRINHHLAKDNRKYEYKHFNPMSMYPIYDDITATSSGIATGDGASKINAYKQIRFDELQFMFQGAIHELITRAEEQEAKEVAQKPVNHYLDMYAVRALSALLDPCNSHLIVNKPFNVQLYHLWPVLQMSRHKCGLIANHIVDTIRRHFDMTFQTDFAQRTEIKSPTSRKRRSLQPVCKTTRQPELETKTVLVNTFTSPYVTKSDQDLLQLCLSEGLSLF